MPFYHHAFWPSCLLHATQHSTSPWKHLQFHHHFSHTKLVCISCAHWTHSAIYNSNSLYRDTLITPYKLFTPQGSFCVCMRIRKHLKLWSTMGEEGMTEHWCLNCFAGVGNYNYIAVLWGMKRFCAVGKRSLYIIFDEHAYNKKNISSEQCVVDSKKR